MATQNVHETNANDLNSNAQIREGNMKVFWLTFVTLFLAELGDKTQLSVILLTSKTKSPVWVFAGAATALILVTLLAVIFGDVLMRYVPERILKKIAALAFILIGVLIFFDKL
jgi:putative Ca2+/H+ antiporter (TMEM165/GDT1 family)